MYGFFGLPKSPGPWQQAVDCQNCGKRIHVSVVNDHECVCADVEAHHLRLLNAEFEQLGATYAWVAFRRWQETPPGRFALWLAAH